MTPILHMSNVSKTFGQVRALSGVNIDVFAGEVHALMGENGAGKSTLMKVLSGAYSPDPGSSVFIEGKAANITSPHEGRSAGIAVIYQELALAPNLTVAENIHLGREKTKFGIFRRGVVDTGVVEILDRLGADFRPSDKVHSLSIAQRQLVEIAKALHGRSKIIVMDEPTTALSRNESEKLFHLIRQLRREGLAIIYVSHRMEEILALADRVTVLRDGSYVATLPKQEISNERIIRLMVGRDTTGFYKKQHLNQRAATTRAEILTVRDVADGGRIKRASLTIAAGEVVGLAGLVGSGRTELAELIYGLRPKVRGEISLCGKQYERPHPRKSLEVGLAYLTEDRKSLGLFMDMSCLENINLGVVDRDAHGGVFLNSRRARERAARAFKAMSIRAPNPTASVGGLSGGNQQKILLSRLLETRPRILILDEPTRGVDVGAKSEIYQIIDNLARTGVGILVISSDLPEITGICDRVLVMREGRIAGEVQPDRTGRICDEKIMTIATGNIAIAQTGGDREH